MVSNVELVPDAAQITLAANSDTFTSTLNGNSDHILLPGSRWRVSLTFSNRKGRAASKLKAQLASLLGVINTFTVRIPDYIQGGTAIGNGQVLENDNPFEILTKGWQANQPLLFAAGDWIELNQQAFMITEDVASNTLGQASLKITPPFRRQPAIDQSIITDDPKFYLRLTDPRGASAALSAAAGSPIYATTIEAVEID